MTTTPSKQKVQEIFEQINNIQKGFLENECGSREKLLKLSYAFSSALELPSETIQRIGWAEVCAWQLLMKLHCYGLTLNSRQGLLSVRLVWTLGSLKV